MWCLRFCAVFVLVACIDATHSNTTEAEDVDSESLKQGVRLLQEIGQSNFSEVIRYHRAKNISECAHFPDTSTRVLQICAIYTLYFRCRVELAPFLFERCQERECFGTFNKNASSCVIRKLGIEIEPNRKGDMFQCGIPETTRALFDWQLPQFAKTIGRESNIDCVWPFPAGSKLAFRIFCDNDIPAVQYRLTFPDDRYLPQDDDTIQCATRVNCTEPRIFLGETVCFRPMPYNPESANLSIKTGESLQQEDNDQDDEEANSANVLMSKQLAYFPFVLLICLLVFH